MNARQKLMLDLFNTAFEGGINYWSVTHQYHWTEDGEMHGIITDVVDDASPQYHVTRSTIIKGYRLATSAVWRDRLAWSSERPPLVVTTDDDWDFDAYDADMIVQLGLFGDVRYG